MFLCARDILPLTSSDVCVFNVQTQSVKEPLPDSPGVSPTAESAHGSSSGMLQYLQSWFPGWGGWYGYAQQTCEGETFEGLLPEQQEQWNPEDILGMTACGFLFHLIAANTFIVKYLIKMNRKNFSVLYCSKIMCVS